MTIGVSMKRKYVTEYSFAYMNSLTVMVAAHQLMQGGSMKADEEEKLSKCHIYFIAARPLPYFKQGSITHQNNQLSGTLCYKIDGHESEISFADYPWELSKDVVKIEHKYPFREVVSYKENGEEDTFVPASHLATLYIPSLVESSPLNQYEILYIGQALGQGNRSAADRLKRHETLQKILALSSYEYPDKEIMLFMFEFENDQLFTSMDGRAKEADNTGENETRLINAMKNPPDKKQKIGMIEAGFIRYFQPKYNEIFKIKFPSSKHKVLQSCIKLDATGLVLELDTSDLGCRLYTMNTATSDHHTAKLDLTSQQNRLSFFHMTGIQELPGVIRG